MKTLITTAALSFLAIANIAEAQPQKNQSSVEVQLMASLPTQDLDLIAAEGKSKVTIHSLVASLPTFDTNVENPIESAKVTMLMASLPTIDENIEQPANRINSSKLMASLPTMDESIEQPANRINISKLMASLPTMDESVEMPVNRSMVSKLIASLPTMDQNIEMNILVDTHVNDLDAKHFHAATRLSEE